VAREERVTSASAISSLPVPLSPVISTVTSRGAPRSTICRMRTTSERILSDPRPIFKRPVSDSCTGVDIGEDIAILGKRVFARAGRVIAAGFGRGRKVRAPQGRVPDNVRWG